MVTKKYLNILIKNTLDVAIEKIKQNTRNFAKRQITWFKKDQDINWFKTVQIKEILEFIEAN